VGKGGRRSLCVPLSRAGGRARANSSLGGPIVFVSRTGFTADAEREIRSSTKHIETLDLDRLVNLWQQHYDKISEPGKALLPLVKVHFLAPAEE